MPITPNNLSAFAKSGGPMAAPPEEMDDAMMDGAEDEAEAVDKFAELRPLLEEYAQEIEACCDEVDPDALRDPTAELAPQDMMILKQGVELLDPKLQMALQNAAQAGITPEEAGNVGMHLEGEGLVVDGDRLAGWLFRVGQALSESAGDPMNAPMDEAADMGAPGNPY